MQTNLTASVAMCIFCAKFFAQYQLNTTHKRPVKLLHYKKRYFCTFEEIKIKDSTNKKIMSYKLSSVKLRS